ncbi:uncharacterized protein LOC126471470 [Schistocerca serialis cubense]|uniref:uncharacterized protein LOC126471470 n=1 Tax=Schistocerca serialis cubense TaxID=2023355 RepID=UPI00214EC0D4|nr:uncharacterized protein LOC126471470 [Schistocerca serialis cubense]
MLRHLTKNARDIFGKFSFKNLVNTCELRKVSSCIIKSRGATSYYANSLQNRKYVNNRLGDAGVNTNSEDGFGRNKKDSWTDSIHLEHSALEFLGWSTALAIGWCMSQPFFRKCILPSDGNKFDKAGIAPNLTRTVFAQPSTGINKTNRSFSYEVTRSTIAQPIVGVVKKDSLSTQTTAHRVENSARSTLTVQEALDKATDNLAQIQKALAGAVDNKLGVKHMESGKKKLAATYFLKSAKLGNRTSIFNMGICYEMGLGVEKDLTQAASCYRMAAEKGHPTAIYNLGVFHMYGLGGVAKDLSHAQELFKYAASLGQREAKEAYTKLSSYLERKQRLKQSTDMSAQCTSSIKLSETSSDKKATLLTDRLSANVLYHRSKFNEVVVPTTSAHDKWTQDFINRVSYLHRPG